MKKTYLFTLLTIVTGISYGQTPCATGRYSSDVYSTIDVTSNIVYGANASFNGANTTLDLDFYEPNGDTSPARPLIIFAHGGSFIGGTKTDPDIVTLCNRFAQKGFVCASINYRVGMWPITATEATKAVLRAVQDMKASIRFFYQDRATTDTYKIDTTQIYVAGTSAGGITAFHLAYLDKECELEGYMTTTTLTALGGLEGTSGNPGYSTTIAGAIGMGGALASYGWIETGDVPFCATHGTADNVVPYNRGMASVAGIGIIELDGSRAMHGQADIVGVSNNFYSHYGAAHVPHVSNVNTMDTTVNFIRDFLIDNMGCTDAALQAENTPLETVDFYDLMYCGLSVNSLTTAAVKRIYPNPSSEKMTIELENFEAVQTIQLFDLSGRIHQTYNATSNVVTISKGNLDEGSYILRTILTDGSSTTNNIVFL
jgi:para-nitrobenzyl esterase